MAALVGALVQVRDALTLIAFLALILLAVFRTKQVPELFFGLVRDKLTRDEFARLLRRFMWLGFAAFLVLVTLAIVAQVLSARTNPDAITIEDLRQELARLEQPDEVAVRVEAQFNLALTLINARDLDGAIEALETSNRILPTRTAHELLAALHRERREFTEAADQWAQAMLLARESGDTVAQVRLDRAGPAPAAPAVEGDTDLIGDATPLAPTGGSFETAVPIAPGFYACASEDGCFSTYYVLPLDSGAALSVRLRSPADGGLAGIVVYGTNGQLLAGAGDTPGTMRGNAGGPSSLYELEWVTDASGPHYLRPNADQGTVYRIRVR